MILCDSSTASAHYKDFFSGSSWGNDGLCSVDSYLLWTAAGKSLTGWRNGTGRVAEVVPPRYREDLPRSVTKGVR